MRLPKPLTKILGWLLLVTTIGVVSCQSLFQARVDNAPEIPFFSNE